MTKRQPRQFGTRPATKIEDSQVGFVLGETKYRCKGDIQGAVILDFIAAAEDGASGAAAKIIPFFESVLPAAEFTKFSAQLKSEDEIIEIETLSEIVGYLIEEYTERPTQESEKLEDGS